MSACPTTYWTYAQTIFYESPSGNPVTAQRDKMLCKYTVDPYSAAVSTACVGRGRRRRKGREKEREGEMERGEEREDRIDWEEKGGETGRGRGRE